MNQEKINNTVQSQQLVQKQEGPKKLSKMPLTPKYKEKVDNMDLYDLKEHAKFYDHPSNKSIYSDSYDYVTNRLNDLEKEEAINMYYPNKTGGK